MGRSGLVFALLAILYVAVLGYGGTNPLVLSTVHIAVFLLTLGVFWRLRSEQVLMHSILLAPLLLVAYVGLQWIVFSGSRTTIETHLLRWLAYFCVFYAAFLMSQDRHARQRVVFGLLTLGFLESLYGLVQYLAGLPYILAWRNLFYADRATGTFVNPNHFAGFLEMILPLGLGVVLHGIDRFRRGRRDFEMIRLDSEQAPRLIFYFFVSLILFLGILFSRSRMGIFSALAAAVAVILLWASASWRRARAIPVLVVFALGALSLGLWLGLEPVIERYEAVGPDYLVRLAIWKNTMALIQARPLLGTGLGTFPETYTQQQTTALTRYVDHAHNDYLQFAAELGILGTILLFGSIALALTRILVGFYRAQRSRERHLLLGCAGSILAILFHSLADFNLQIPANALVFAVILGLGSGLRESGATTADGVTGSGRTPLED